MLFSIIFNLSYIILIGIAGYYVSLYSQLNDSIIELSNKIDKKCNNLQNIPQPKKQIEKYKKHSSKSK